jgi:hypothetical protein
VFPEDPDCPTLVVRKNKSPAHNEVWDGAGWDGAGGGRARWARDGAGRGVQGGMGRGGMGRGGMGRGGDGSGGHDFNHHFIYEARATRAPGACARQIKHASGLESRTKPGPPEAPSSLGRPFFGVFFFGPWPSRSQCRILQRPLSLLRLGSPRRGRRPN